MEASRALDVGQSASRHASTLGIVAADGSLRARVMATGTKQGYPLRASASSVSELVADCALQDPSMLILCVSSAEQRTEEIRLFRGRFPSVPIVIVVSARDTRAGLRPLLEEGVEGLIVDSDVESALGATVHAVECGQVAVPRELAPRAKAPALSYREKQILGLVVMGFTNADIARKLFLAESTVKSHLSSAFGKLGVRSRHEAAALLTDPGQLGLGVLTIARG